MREKIHAYLYWGGLWCATVVGHIPSHTVRNWYYRRVMKISLPNDSIMYWGARFFGWGSFEIGRRTILGDHGFFDMRRGITIGDDVNIASEVRIWTAQHDIDIEGSPVEGGKVTIGDRAFIGSRVTILPGVSIGEGVVVGSGAVVTKDLPSWTVCFGVPARPVRERRVMKYELDTSERALFQ